MLQVFAATLLAAAVFWMLNNARKGTSDAAKYQQWQRSIYPYERVVFVERQLPTGLGRVLRLPALEQRYLQRDEQICEALLASGYLTNVPITVTNAAAQFAEINGRIRKATQGSRAKWELGTSGNSFLVLRCRPQDVPVCTRRLATK